MKRFVTCFAHQLSLHKCVCELLLSNCSVLYSVQYYRTLYADNSFINSLALSNVHLPKCGVPKLFGNVVVTVRVFKRQVELVISFKHLHTFPLGR